MFKFKQFSVEDDRSTMKVGTDAVLLAATLKDGKLPACSRILDIGTGCGLIALMLAQQHPTAHIDAIDIDSSSVEQSAENFLRSPWPDRLHAHLCPLQDYQAAPYHLIVTNPPYFTASLKNPDLRKARARHNDTLPLADLLLHALRLLAPHGRLSLILPLPEAQHLATLAPSYGLHPIDSILIQNRADLPPKRRIITLSTDLTPKCHQNTLVLHLPDGRRTPEHHLITQDYYL